MACKYYGFTCGFETKENKVEKVIEEFRKHTIQEHYIDYSEGVLLNFIMRKNKIKIL